MPFPARSSTHVGEGGVLSLARSSTSTAIQTLTLRQHATKYCSRVPLGPPSKAVLPALFPSTARQSLPEPAVRGQAWPSIGHFDPMTFIQHEPARLPQDAATQQQDQLPRRARASLGLLGASALLFTLGACGAGGGSGGSKNAFGTPGEVGDKPGGGFYIVDGNQAGNAQEPRLYASRSDASSRSTASTPWECGSPWPRSS